MLALPRSIYYAYIKRHYILCHGYTGRLTSNNGVRKIEPDDCKYIDCSNDF